MVFCNSINERYPKYLSNVIYYHFYSQIDVHFKIIIGFGMMILKITPTLRDKMMVYSITQIILSKLIIIFK